ncbi:MAG: diaminopimelate epimerase [Rickettsiales bacterium]|nr:diaminopimelate epimerase [Pseudomonadota bacterium]MDA0966784.1 diaminopimelate epimerase [Pseudomonadota bacterium]MDG4543456.1 diaminopimelate epimerase [Rickettsiales bacterium]MDG4546150.1 diaminopimelate epimerase [Rickettsiales bacterium]MDG4547623.1 diaminopimelate epimerase [Rickettsiales bacterium]
MENIPFLKMHGLGNDFVIIDGREKNYSFTSDEVQKICDRHTGVGCDQFVVIEDSEKADCLVNFYNADGSKSGACGNATRCVAWIIIKENNRENVSIETAGGILNCEKRGFELVSVDMGIAKTAWQDIPLSKDVDTLHLPLSSGQLKDGVAVSMGNPHAVFFVENVDSVDLQNSGAKLEVNELFPQRANISAAQIISNKQIKLQVWERGAGETKACGTGACAAVVAANLRGLVEQDVEVNLPGGDLQISYINGRVNMTGAVATVFKGILL